MALHSRRRFLATAGITGTTLFSGCSFIRSGNGFGNDWPKTADGTTDPLPGGSTDWPQYGRNPGHTGFTPDIEVDDPSEDWTFELSGSLAPPAIVGDRVFVHGGGDSESAEDDYNGVIFSLQADDGSQQWRRELPRIGFGGFSGCPPIVSGGSVYVGHAGENGVYAIDARDGSRRWRFDTGNSVNEAAVGYQGLIFVSTGDELLAFDDRGRNQWTYRTGDDRSSFYPPAAGGDYVLYSTSVIGSVVAIPPAGGSGDISEWRYQGDPGFGTATVADGIIYIPGDDRLHAIDLATGDGIWTAEVRVSAGVATDGERIFFTTGSGNLAAHATADGSEQWRTDLAPRDGVYLRTRPLVTAQSVIVTTEKPQMDERVTTYAVDRRTDETRWTLDQPGNVGFDAVAAGGRLYVPVYWSTRDAGGTLIAVSD